MESLSAPTLILAAESGTRLMQTRIFIARHFVTRIKDAKRLGLGVDCRQPRSVVRVVVLVFAAFPPPAPAWRTSRPGRPCARSGR